MNCKKEFPAFERADQFKTGDLVVGFGQLAEDGVECTVTQVGDVIIQTTKGYFHFKCLRKLENLIPNQFWVLMNRVNFQAGVGVIQEARVCLQKGGNKLITGPESWVRVEVVAPPLDPTT